eukprot:TRINITY_DN21537_c0_g2_i1.p2 TRINITY_DN21537_c0_g2~~TRINITY_DN21537_c0_g2_i1.p2  ORF type:complete len:139 (+),score=43.19 TRINITY_DN21537_c0_g2_i1:96-512(+)
MGWGMKLFLGVVAIVGIVVAVVALQPKPAPVAVTVPEEGPAQVEESVPSKPEDKLAYDRRKAASACRVAIMQSLRDPSTALFLDEIDKTEWASEAGGDYRFKIGVKAKSDAGVVSRHFDCKAHPEINGWSIAELKEGA